MDSRDLTMLASFLITFIALAYFLAGTVTGRAVDSIYCTDAGCLEGCRSQDDCFDGDICCEQLGRGVCLKECEIGSEFLGQDSGVNLLDFLYIGFLMLTLVIGAGYIYYRSKGY